MLEEFLKPMGLSRYRLAKEIDVPPQRIGEIVAGRRSITADTDLRLCRFFGLSKGYWLRAQAAHDSEVAEEELAESLAKIKPWEGCGHTQGTRRDALPHHPEKTVRSAIAASGKGDARARGTPGQKSVAGRPAEESEPSPCSIARSGCRPAAAPRAKPR